MKDYKEVIRKQEVTGNKENYRIDYGKVFVFTNNIPTDQLRSDLENIIGEIPLLNKFYRVYGVLYVLPTDIPQRMPAKIKKEIQLHNLNSSAVFIRCSTPTFLFSQARNEASYILLRALRDIQREYGNDKILWRFREAEQLLDTEETIKEYDLELAQMEWLGHQNQ